MLLPGNIIFFVFGGFIVVGSLAGIGPLTSLISRAKTAPGILPAPRAENDAQLPEGA